MHMQIMLPYGSIVSIHYIEGFYHIVISHDNSVQSCQHPGVIKIRRKIRLYILGPNLTCVELNLPKPHRVGNSLIGFLSGSLVFAKKRLIRSFAQKKSDLLIRSFLVSDLRESLTVTHFW